MKQAKWFLLLHVILGIYAGSSVCSKLAAQQPFLSAAFIVLYGLMLLALVTYAVGWQQVIKHLPLTTAYANKAVTVVWGILLGLAVFGEAVTPRQVIGAVIIICGIVLFVRADNEGEGGKSGTAALCAAVSVQHVPLRGLAGAFEEGRAAGAQVGLGGVHRLAGDFRLCPLCGLHALNDAGLQGRTAQRRACTGSNRLYLRHDFWRYDLPREDEPQKARRTGDDFGRHPCICAVTKNVLPATLRRQDVFLGHLEFLWFFFCKEKSQRKNLRTLYYSLSGTRRSRRRTGLLCKTVAA
jgi:multidrug transporter EmrE-like cation transporter